MALGDQAVELLAIGARLDRYVVVGRLGAGRHAVVYAAHDREHDRRIAIKLLREVDPDPAARAARRGRVLATAKAVAAVTHPHVLPVHGANVVDVAGGGEHVYVAMELATGGSLRAWCARRRTWRDVRDRFVEAGRGLAALHAAGLVHGDFTANGALIDDADQVRLTDVGLAAGDDASPADDQRAFCAALCEALPPRPKVPPRITAALARGQAEAPADRWPSIDALLDALADDPDADRRRWLGAAAVALLVALVVVAAMLTCQG